MNCCCGVPGPMWQSVVNWTFMTLFFPDQEERVSQIFSLQPSQAVKEIAAGSLSPHYTSSQRNTAFSLTGEIVRQLKSGSCGPLHMVMVLWKPRDYAHCNHSNSTSPRSSHYGWTTAIVHKASVVFILVFVTAPRGFHLLTRLFNQTECQPRGFCLHKDRYYCIIANWLTSNCIYSTNIILSLLCSGHCASQMKITKWAKPNPSPQGAHSCTKDADI